MHSVATLGLTPDFSDFRGMSATPPGGYNGSGFYPAGQAMDPAQLQHLVQLLGSKQQQAAGQPAALTAMPKQTAVVECPKSMVGRVIGKGGETIKALQQYTGAMIQIDQSTDPTRVTIAGSPQSLQLAVSMVHDIVRGTFKGFAMLRQISIAASAQAMGQFGPPQPVYVQGYGFVPPSQVFNPEDSMSASLLRTSPSPTGPLTPPMTPLRATPPSMPADQLAALLGGQGQQHAAQQLQQQQQFSAGHGNNQDALIAQLLNQLTMQPGSQPHPAPQQRPQEPPSRGGALDQGAIQTLLAQAGLMGAGQAAAAANAHPGLAQVLPPTSAPNLPLSTSLMLSAQGTPAVVTSAGQSPYGGLARSDTASGPASTGTISPPHGSFAGTPPASTAAQQSGYAAALLQHATSAAQGASFLGTSPGSGASGRSSPAFPGLASAANAAALSSRRPPSGESSPLGRFGAIGTGVAGGSVGGGFACEDSLASRLGVATSEGGTSREGSPLRHQGRGD